MMTKRESLDGAQATSPESALERRIRRTTEMCDATDYEDLKRACRKARQLHDEGHYDRARSVITPVTYTASEGMSEDARAWIFGDSESDERPS